MPNSRPQRHKILSPELGRHHDTQCNGAIDGAVSPEVDSKLTDIEPIDLSIDELGVGESRAHPEDDGDDGG